jgi:hypothetical protein
MHIFNVTIPGLLVTLTGHIVLEMTMASFLGIRVLCKAGCKVVFTNTMCQVIYKGNVILTGYKDRKSNLLTLPIFQEAEICNTTPTNIFNKNTTEHASFLYHQANKENDVKFMHQSLCNPPILSLLKAINAGFLKGALHPTAKTVQKYLMPSPTTSKGHMKQPRKGLRITTPRIKLTPTTAPSPAPLPRPIPIVPARYHDMPGLIRNNYSNDSPNHHSFHTVKGAPIANVFCFGAFADKVTGVVYNDCTGKFPFMSLDGNVCFFVMYHYKKKYNIGHTHTRIRFKKHFSRIFQEL